MTAFFENRFQYGLNEFRLSFPQNHQNYGSYYASLNKYLLSTYFVPGMYQVLGVL